MLRWHQNVSPKSRLERLQRVGAGLISKVTCWEFIRTNIETILIFHVILNMST